jgi:hypothetical protein
VDQETLKRWMRDTLLALPVNREIFYTQIWKGKKIQYQDHDFPIDRVDEINAKLVCTALDKQLPLFIVFPDFKLNRGALILSTVLIKLAYNSIKKLAKPETIGVWGNNSHLKFFIEKTFIAEISIASVFSYSEENAKNNSRHDSVIDSDYLPKVVCFYNADDPLKYIKRLNCRIVFIDAGSRTLIPVLNSILQYCNSRGILVIGWATNSISEIPNIFECNNGSVIYYPSKKEITTQTKIQDLFLKEKESTFFPIVLSGQYVDELDSQFLEVRKVLFRLGKNCVSKFKKDAVKLCWKYYRNLESLVIPVAFYESSITSFWGCSTLAEIRDFILKYANTLKSTDSELSNEISSIVNRLDSVRNLLEKHSPPLWTALNEVCLTSSDVDTCKAIVFQKQHQKRLFSYVLLSKFNISEDDLLRDYSVILKTFSELQQTSLEDQADLKGYQIRYILVGLPDLFNKNLIYSVIDSSPQVIIYATQSNALAKLIQDFNQLEKDHLRKNLKTLKRLSYDNVDITPPSRVNRIVLSSNVIKMNIAEGNVKTETTFHGLAKIGDLQEELSVLFDHKNVGDEDSFLPKTNLENEPHKLFEESPVEIYFEEGYKIIVSEDQQLNVIQKGKIELVFVRALIPGMKIFIVEDSARKNLYDLILSRVHNHPSLAIHMGFLHKWKEEFHIGYLIWKETKTQAEMQNFLKQMQSKGSNIVTPLTIINWISGNTLRPIDSENIRRVGEIINSNFIIKNYREIHKAASRIVGIHIRLARQINHLLTINDIERSQFEIIDPTTGLTFGELMSSGKILSIKNIEISSPQILVSELGLLQKV